MSRIRSRALKRNTSRVRKRVRGGDTKIHVGGIFLSPPQIMFTIGSAQISMMGSKKDEFVVMTGLSPISESISDPQPWEFIVSNGTCELRLSYEPGKSNVSLPGTLELVTNKVVSVRMDLSSDDAQKLHDAFLASKLFKMTVSSPVNVNITPKSLQSLPPELVVKYKATKRVVRIH